MSDYSWKELMAVVFAREIKDTDKITSGAHTEISSRLPCWRKRRTRPT